MKPASLLLQAALVVGGLLLYHVLVAPAGPRGAPTYEAAEPPSHEDDDPVVYPPAPAVLEPGAGEQARRNTEALAALREEVARLRAALRARPAEAGGGNAARERAAGAAEAFAGVDPDDPRFDEDTLASLETMIDEINRRKAVARNRMRIGEELARLGVDLDDQQRTVVVDATLAFQAKARDLAQRAWSRDEAGRTARREALARLRDEYTATIHTLVPVSEAEKITSSRITRSQGSGFPTGRRRGGDR